MSFAICFQLSESSKDSKISPKGHTKSFERHVGFSLLCSMKTLDIWDPGWWIFTIWRKAEAAVLLEISTLHYDFGRSSNDPWNSLITLEDWSLGIPWMVHIYDDDLCYMFLHISNCSKCCPALLVCCLHIKRFLHIFKLRMFKMLSGFVSLSSSYQKIFWGLATVNVSIQTKSCSVD